MGTFYARIPAPLGFIPRPDYLLNFMSPKFTSLLSQSVGNALAKQLAFSDFLGDRSWSVDLTEGCVTFGHDLSYPIQLLGTEAEGDASWLWAWANEQSQLPPAVLHRCHQLKELGLSQQIPQFVNRSFSIEIANGHEISMIASGLNPTCCYYRGPYDGGALYFLVQNVPQEMIGRVASERAVTVLTESIAQFDVDHCVMVKSFLPTQGFSLQQQSNKWIAARGNDVLTITFDQRQRIENIAASLKPAPAAEQRW